MLLLFLIQKSTSVAVLIPILSLCSVAVRGPCWAEGSAIEAPIFNGLLSPIGETSDVPIPQKASECYTACMANDDCFVWLWANQTIDGRGEGDPLYKKGCHLRGLGSGVQSRKPGVISGYKYGNINDETCKSLTSSMVKMKRIHL